MTTKATPTAEKFKREVIFFPAFDKRDPNPSKNYGIGNANVLFVLKGKKGAVTFEVSSGWYLPQQVAEHGQKPWSQWQPSGSSIAYHSRKKRYEEQHFRTDCAFVGGKRCYSDASYCYADDIFKILVAERSEPMWRKLEEFYQSSLN